MELKLYVITRKSTGYAELESVSVVAPNEDAARLAIIRHYGEIDGITEFADPERSTAIVAKLDSARILSQSFAAS